MRTKHLLMTMALPLAFAACTSEEFESYDNNVSLAQRPEIGQVDIAFNVGDAQTRWTDGFDAEVNDRVGAALIDQPATPVDETKDKWEGAYTPTTYISTNYMYQNNGTSWASNANLVEGNYMFYAPYNEKHQVRTAIRYQAPVKQDLTVEGGKVVASSAKEAVAESSEYPFYVGYRFLDATEDNRSISVNFRPIFAYPQFKLKNNSGSAVTITRILVQSSQNNIPVSAEFSNGDIIKKMHSTEKGSWGDDNLSNNYRGNLATTDLLASDVEKTSLIRADLSEAVTLANGDEMTYQLVMPAMKFGQGEMSIYYVTSGGRAYVQNVSNTTITLVPGRRYPAEDYQQTGTVKPVAGDALTKTIAVGESLQDAPYIVTSKDELVEAINNAPANLTSPLRLTLVGEVDFDEQVLRTIAEELAQPVIFEGALNIIGGTAAAPMNIDQKVIFDEATVKSGYVTFNKADSKANVYDGVNFKKLTVAEGATLTVTAMSSVPGDEITVDEDGKYTATSANAKIINNGTLVLNDDVELVENNGALTIGEKGKFSDLTSTNKENNQTVAINSDYEFDGEKIEGKWTVADGAILTLTLDKATELPWGSSLTVNGDLAGKNGLTVSGTMTLAGELNTDLTLAGTYVEEPTEEVPNKEAVLDLQTGAMLIGSVEGKDATNKKAQVVKIADNSVGFLNTFNNSNNLVAQYTHSGNVTKTGDIVVPEKANKLVIAGSIATAENLTVGNATTLKLEEIIVEDNINAVNGTVTIATAGTTSTVNVNGDVMATKEIILTNVKELVVEGSLVTSAGGKMTASSLENLEMNDVRMAGTDGSDNWNLSALKTACINGQAEFYQCSGFPEETELTLKGNLYVAENKWIELSKKTTIAANVTVSGAGTVNAQNATEEPFIHVNADCVLTINVNMAGHATYGLCFVSNQPVATDGEKNPGKVENNGTMTNASMNYDILTSWWSGTGSVTAKS